MSRALCRDLKQLVSVCGCSFGVKLKMFGVSNFHTFIVSTN